MTKVDVARIRGFYGLVDVPPDAGPAEALAVAEQLVAGGAPIVQLRMKGAGTRSLITCALALRTWTRQRGVLFCVNDRIDVAQLVEADVVHLGQEDLPLAMARQQADRLRIGISTHSLAQAEAALSGGADYLGFGPIFATRTKENPDPVQGVDRLAEVCKLAGPVPVVALGGVTLENVAQVAKAGAAAVAAVECVRKAPDPIAVVARLHRAILAAAARGPS